MIGVILFAQYAVVNFSVTEYFVKDDLKAAVNRIVYSEITNPDHYGTNTSDALNLLRIAGQRGGALNLRNDDPIITQIAIVITDGVANNPFFGTGKSSSARITRTAVDNLKKSEIYEYIFAVGVEGKKGNIKERQLKDIATADSFVFKIDDFNQQQFEEFRQNITRQVCKGKYT